MVSHNVIVNEIFDSSDYFSNSKAQKISSFLMSFFDRIFSNSVSKKLEINSSEIYFLPSGQWSFVKDSPFWFNAVIIKDAIYTIGGDLIDTLSNFNDFSNQSNVDISALDPNVEHCILVKKSQNNPTTNPTTTSNPTTTTTNPTTTTTATTSTAPGPTSTAPTTAAPTTTATTTTADPNITTTIQYEYELVDCNGPLEAYRLCYKEPLNCSEQSPGTNRRKRAAVVDTIKDDVKYKASHGELPCH